MVRQEHICSSDGAGEVLSPGVSILPLVGEASGAERLYTALASIQPGCELAYHIHPCAEAIVVLDGCAEAVVDGRRYSLKPFDALVAPPHAPHLVRNGQATSVTRLLVAFASSSPSRELVSGPAAITDFSEPPAFAAEALTRFESADAYDLAPGAHFRTLFAAQYGSSGICGGYGLFQPGASLPCHIHDYDESISIIDGLAICQVAGRRYEVGNVDTALVPRGRPHRFINEGQTPMAMIWVYAGGRPERALVAQEQCDGPVSCDQCPTSVAALTTS